MRNKRYKGRLVWGAKCKVIKMRVFTLFLSQIAYLAKYAKWQMPNCIQSNFDTMPPFGTERKWHSSEGGIVTRICKNSLVM